MSTPEQDAALAADEASRQAFKAWQAEPFQNAKRRDELFNAYQDANAEARRLWDLVGPDPILSQINTMQALSDEAEGHDADGE